MTRNVIGQNDPERAAAVREACLPLEACEEDLGPGLRRGIYVRPEFDCWLGCAWGSDACRPGAGGFHGSGARTLVFYVCSPGVAGVGFDLHTPILLPETAARYEEAPLGEWPTYDHFWCPMGSVDYHLAEASPEKVEEHWLSETEGPCKVAGSEERCFSCWGTSLEAETAVEIVLAGGPTALWSWLAEQWFPYALELAK